MTTRQHQFSERTHPFFLVHTGLETDLIFNRGVDLPGFAAYPARRLPEWMTRPTAMRLTS